MWSLEVDGLDEQPQRDTDAGVPVSVRARWRSPGAQGASGCGTSPSASTPTTRSCRSRRPGGSATSGGCGRWGSPRAKTTQMPVEPADVGDAGEPAVVEGVKGQWRVAPVLSGRPRPFEGRAALLSPFDRLVHDRKRALELFEFEYQLEMYKPAAQATVGVLRAADPLRGSAPREARRRRRPQDRRPAGERDPRGPAVLAGGDGRRRVRDRGPGPLARAGDRLLPLTGAEVLVHRSQFPSLATCHR